MEHTTDTQIFFWQGEFSNKHRFSFVHNGNKFAHVEQAFMWEKANFFRDEQAANLILVRTNPNVIYNLGKSIEGFDPDEWERVRFGIMVRILHSRWSSSDDAKKKLTDTHPKTLVYGDPYNDIWGVGLHWKDPMIRNEDNWRGENLLGKALEEVRSKLMNNAYSLGTANVRRYLRAEKIIKSSPIERIIDNVNKKFETIGKAIDWIFTRGLPPL